MDLQEIQTFHAARGTKTPEQIADFSAKLMAAHDEIVPYPGLVEMLQSEVGQHADSKPARKAIYAALEAESRKYPAAVVYEDPLFGKPFLALRSKMEAFRGIKRDRGGKLLFTNEERTQKIADIRGKIAEVLGPDADMSQTYGPWIEQMKVEIQRHQDYIDGKLKADGTIWDFINGESAKAPVAAEGEDR